MLRKKVGFSLLLDVAENAHFGIACFSQKAAVKGYN